MVAPLQEKLPATDAPSPERARENAAEVALLSIASLKVTLTSEVRETATVPAAGLRKVTVGAMASAGGVQER